LFSLLVQEAVQLFEGAAPAPAFGSFGNVASQMQFGAVAAAFGQQQHFGHGGGVDWSSPAPSPPPFVGTGLAPNAVFGPSSLPAGPYGQALQLQPPPPAVTAPPSCAGHTQPPPGVHRPAKQLEDPAAALPDDVFDLPVQQQQTLQSHHSGQTGQANGQGPRPRGFQARNHRPRSMRFMQPQHQQPQHGSAFGHQPQHGVYPPSAAGYPAHMPGWWVALPLSLRLC
jgi:hypothetical protein